MRGFFGELYQQESRRVFSTLVRLLGDFALAEEATQEAFAAAVEQWQQYGKPATLWGRGQSRSNQESPGAAIVRTETLVGLVLYRLLRPRAPLLHS